MNNDMVTITIPKDVFEALEQLLGQFLPILQQAKEAQGGQENQGNQMTPDQQAMQQDMIAMEAAQKR